MAHRRRANLGSEEGPEETGGMEESKSKSDSSLRRKGRTEKKDLALADDSKASSAQGKSKAEGGATAESVGRSSEAAGSKRSRRDSEKQNRGDDTEQEAPVNEDCNKKTAKKPKASAKVEEGADNKKSGAALTVPPKKAKWKVDDAVYGLNRGDLYLAKVLKVRSDFKRGFPVWQYFLHYQGWSKKWDEWVNEDITHPNTEKTREMQKNLKEENKKRREELGKLRSKQAKEGAKDKKQESDSNIDFEAVEVTEKAYKINIPNVLQRRLLDDLDKIEDRKLICLPRTPSIRQLLKDFQESKAVQASKDETLVDVIEGLELYCDRVLPTMLLYDFEFVQYKRYLAENPGVKGSQVYGGEHLLRLFVKLPALFQSAKIQPAAVQAIQPRVVELLKFMEKHVEHYCVAQYDPADLEYMEMVQKAHGK